MRHLHGVRLQQCRALLHVLFSYALFGSGGAIYYFVDAACSILTPLLVAGKGRQFVPYLSGTHPLAAREASAGPASSFQPVFAAHTVPRLEPAHDVKQQQQQR